jgi:type III pantothenate kinase
VSPSGVPPGSSGADAAPVLLVDIGNTRIKWAWWREGRVGPMRAAAHAGWSAARFAERVLAARRTRVARVVVASVAGGTVDRLFASAAKSALEIEPRFLESARSAAGVTTRYREPWRLGVDRFVAAIGAHHLVGRRGACVVNAGTTVTIDFVDAGGVHLGGLILPGAELMVSSLKKHTAGIAQRARERGPHGGRSPRGGSPFARSTKEAIWQGAWHAVAAAVERACAEAGERLGDAPLILLSGGGAQRLERLVRAPHLSVPDLVLRGIAVHAGLALR